MHSLTRVISNDVHVLFPCAHTPNFHLTEIAPFPKLDHYPQRALRPPLFCPYQRLNLSTSHVGSVETIYIILLRATVLIANCAALFLCSCNLGLKRGGIGINPLKLCKVSVENANDLAQLRGS